MAVAAVTAPGTLYWKKLTRSRRRFGWNVIYDEPVNQGDPLEDSKRAPDEESASDPARQREMWKITYQPENRETRPYEVKNGSLVVIEMRNAGSMVIREPDFDGRRITCQFPGRKVVHFKIRDNDAYRDTVLKAARTLEPGQHNKFDLPAPRLNLGESFKVMVLLDSPDGDRPNRNRMPKAKEPKVRGDIRGGSFMQYGRLSWRRLWPWIVPGVLVAGVLGLGFGFWWGNGGNVPDPTCATGSLDIEGSTAFAPIMNQVVTDYERRCTQAHITISAVGSLEGLTDLEHGKPALVMYDGDPPAPPGPPVTSRPAGVVIFSVVGNRSLAPSLFTAGMTSQAIAETFEHPRGSGYSPVGRTPLSGTREAFVQHILGNDDAAEKNARGCPPPGRPATRACLETTTMQVLTYINQTPGAIGYAESDALPFFPSVATIPVNGHAPTRDNVLGGNYTFDATEHLYAKGKPSGLEADVIAFLNSPAESARLSGAGFIPCQDLGGSKIANACGG